MNDADKDKIKKILNQHKDGIRQIRELLMNLPEAKEARKYLNHAEFNVLHAMHKIGLIGFEYDYIKEDYIKEEVLSHTNDDNPSAK